MARRNPLEEMKKKYFQNLKISKVHPWLFYHSCIKCGDEFCREPIYECIEPSICFSSERYYYRGCTHCFNSVENFRKYLEDKDKICVENDFVNYKVLGADTSSKPDSYSIQFYVMVQARKHKKKRINKKWLKRYGYKCVPDNDKMIVSNNKLFMTKGAYERVKKGIKVIDVN